MSLNVFDLFDHHQSDDDLMMIFLMMIKQIENL